MEAIRPNKARAGLFSVARQIDPGDPTIDWTPDGGWATNSTCPAGGTWCCDDTGTVGPTGEPLEKCEPNQPQGGRFTPFMVYQTAGCNSGTSRTPKSTGEAAAHTAEWIDVNMEGWITQAIEEGICNNVPLFQVCTDVTGLGAANINAGIATLLRNRAQRFSFDRPTLHVPSWFAPIIDDNQWIAQVADIAFGPGYGTGPTVGALTPPGEAWIYLTGPFEYSIAPMIEMSKDTLEEWRQNIDVQLIERVAVYRFDPCNCFRIRVNSF